MHRILTSIALTAVALILAGCGGGGGGSVTVAPSIVGTWRVPSLGLPQDQMMIGSTGDVFVKGDAPTARASSTRAGGDYYTRIGTCNTSGSVIFGGSWRNGGSVYVIRGSGSITPGHTITAVVTLYKDNRIIIQGGPASGDLADDTPPPIPDFPPDDNGGFDPPPEIPL